MSYTAKDFSFLLGMKGFSDTLLKNHFTLYQGYVTNTNKLMELLTALLKDGKQGTPEFAELKRRFGWEFNGMRLHELYFENLGGDGNQAKAPRLAERVAAQFGWRPVSRTSWPVPPCGASAGWSVTKTLKTAESSISGSMSMMWAILPAAIPS